MSSYHVHNYQLTKTLSPSPLTQSPLETHIAGVSRCQRIMTETTAELNELKYDMERELTNMGYTDSSKYFNVGEGF